MRSLSVLANWTWLTGISVSANKVKFPHACGRYWLHPLCYTHICISLIAVSDSEDVYYSITGHHTYFLYFCWGLLRSHLMTMGLLAPDAALVHGFRWGEEDTGDADGPETNIWILKVIVMKQSVKTLISNWVTQSEATVKHQTVRHLWLYRC